MKKVFKTFMALVLAVFTLAGCAKEVTPIDGAQFEAKAEELGYFVYDQSDMTKEDNPLIDQSVCAFSKYDQNLTFEFDVYLEEKDAIDLFNYLVVSFEYAREKGTKATVVQEENFYQMSLDDTYFYYVRRAGKTLFISVTTEVYKADVIAMAEAIGY